MIWFWLYKQCIIKMYLNFVLFYHLILNILFWFYTSCFWVPQSILYGLYIFYDTQSHCRATLNQFSLWSKDIGCIINHVHNQLANTNLQLLTAKSSSWMLEQNTIYLHAYFTSLLSVTKAGSACHIALSRALALAVARARLTPAVARKHLVRWTCHTLQT